MGRITSWLDNNYYSSYDKNWDDLMFRNEILEVLNPGHTILDLGAGAGIINYMNFRGLVKEVCGVDLDPRVVKNAFLDEGKITDASRIPYEDAKFDVVFSDNVLEHLDSPIDVFKEVFRVLKPGGLFLFKTPNKWHYMPTISRLTPHKFHQFVNRLRGREEEDTFPTHYKANAQSKIKKLAKVTGFNIIKIDLIEGRPEYLRMFWFTYIFGILYERFVNSGYVFKNLRILLIGILQKQ